MKRIPDPDDGSADGLPFGDGSSDGAKRGIGSGAHPTDDCTLPVSEGSNSPPPPRPPHNRFHHFTPPPSLQALVKRLQGGREDAAAETRG